ncbi:MAG: iron-sulfur cluster assembly scaffold protein [Candidatus Methylomirabilia bacterium]
MNYSAALIDHFRNPRNVGMMRNPDGVGEEEFEECGDVARFYLRVAAHRVAEVRFQTYGCGPTIAAASAGSELATGLDIRRLLEVTADQVEAAVDGLPGERRHAADLVAAGLRAAARDCLRRHGAPVETGGEVGHV